MAEDPDTLVRRLRRRWDQAETFIKRDLWLRLPERRGPRAIYRLLRMSVLIFEGFAHSEVFLLSAALTYQVIFALVPLLVVMLAVVKGFGGLEAVGGEVQKVLLRYITPQMGDVLANNINSFIAKINVAAVGVIGFALLLYTTLSFLTTIEKAFNKIWGIRTHRTLLRRFTMYWTLVTVSPILIAASLSLTTFVHNNALYGWLNQHVPFFGKVTLTLTAYLVAWIMFTCFYLFMPNTRVKFTAAVLGALVSGTCWRAMTDLYAWYNSHVVTAYTFYGSLGAIPVFLLWVYLSWIVVLFGAEIAFAAQHVGTYKREVEQVKLCPADCDRLALVIAVEAVKPFQRGEPPPSGEDVATRLNMPVRIVNEILFELTSQGILREVALHGRKESGYLPARDPGVTTAKDVLLAIRSFGNPCIAPATPEADRIWKLVDRAEAHATGPLEGVTLRELATAPTTTPRADGSPEPALGSEHPATG